MNLPKCFQCPNPAMYKVGEVPLCLDCYFKVFQIQQAQQENIERELNYTSDLMRFQVGLTTTSPSYPPRRAIHVGGMTLNNINVDNSTIGSINTGTINSLDIAITSVKGSDPKVAKALTQLSQAVLSHQNLAQEARVEILEILSALASEVSTPKERQKPSVTKILFVRLGELVNLAQGLSALWAQWSPIIGSALGG